MFNSSIATKIFCDFVDAYFVKRDLNTALSYISDDVVAIGSGRSDIVMSKQQLTTQFLKEVGTGSFGITFTSIPTALPLCPECYTVFATISLTTAAAGASAIDPFQLRAHIVVSLEQGQPKINTIHFSTVIEDGDISAYFSEDNTHSMSRVHLLETIADNIEIGFLTANLDEALSITYQNRKAFEYFGYDNSEDFITACNGEIINFIHPEDREGVIDMHKMLVATKQPVSFTNRGIHRNGSIIWFSGRISCMPDNKGNLIGIYAFQDITTEKRIRDELHVSDERFKIAFQQTDSIIFDYDVHNRTLNFLYGHTSPFGELLKDIRLDDISPAPGYISKAGMQNFFQMLTQIENGADNANCYLELDLGRGSMWVKISLKNVFDERGIVKAVGIISDVTAEKDIEQKYEQELLYRSRVEESTLSIFEVNLSQSLFDNSALTDSGGAKYSRLLLKNADLYVHADDRAAFISHFNYIGLLDAYKHNAAELSLEFRFRPEGETEYLWANSKTHLVRMPGTKDIYAFTYIYDIDEQKKQVQELEYQAQRDLLTSLYNKKTTEMLVGKHLAEMRPGETCALLIIDLDDFKQVNDQHGHLVGDAVLSEIGHMLTGIFRDTDIVGRIGGDEFAVCMKNVTTFADCEAKADEICQLFRKSTGQDRQFIPSGTVGISLSPDHGSSFMELYKNADTALYYAKSLGKDRYYIYNPEIDELFNYSPKLDQENGGLQKNFRDNIIEYIFKILHHSSDLSSSIQSVLRLLCLHFNVSRGYIFENSEDGLFSSNTFEWCAEGISPQIGELQNIPFDEVDNYDRHFEENNLYIVEDVSHTGDDERALLESQGITSMFQCGIRFDGQFKGFMGFDMCGVQRAPSEEEVDIAATATDIVGSFLMLRRKNEQLKRSEEVMKTILDNLHSYTYVINPDTFELMFINQMTSQVAPEAACGDTCYRALRGLQDVCDDCPVRLLKNGENTVPYYEIYNKTLDIWSQTSANEIKWVDGSNAFLLNCIDITAYKKGQEK